MSSCARLAKVLGGVLAVWGAAGVVLVSAQGRLEGRFGKGSIPQPKLPDLHVDGTIEDIRPGMIQVLSSNSAQTWLLRILPQARIQILGKATLQVPNAPFRGALKIEIAEGAEIDVDLSSPAAVSLAQKGDKVRARGQQLGEQAGQVNDLEITLSQTLGAAQAKKRPAPKAERTGRSKRAAEPEEKAPAIEPQRHKDTKKEEG